MTASIDTLMSLFAMSDGISDNKNVSLLGTWNQSNRPNQRFVKIDPLAINEQSMS